MTPFDSGTGRRQGSSHPRASLTCGVSRWQARPQSHYHTDLFILYGMYGRTNVFIYDQPKVQSQHYFSESRHSFSIFSVNRPSLYSHLANTLKQCRHRSDPAHGKVIVQSNDSEVRPCPILLSQSDSEAEHGLPSSNAMTEVTKICPRFRNALGSLWQTHMSPVHPVTIRGSTRMQSYPVIPLGCLSFPLDKTLGYHWTHQKRPAILLAPSYADGELSIPTASTGSRIGATFPSG
jgi:hypothetical protein